MEATCSGDPKLHFRMIVTFSPDGTAKLSEEPNPWRDIVPGTSTQTLHRFLCDDQPANAYYPVSLNDDTPEKDAMTFFTKQK